MPCCSYVYNIIIYCIYQYIYRVSKQTQLWRSSCWKLSVKIHKFQVLLLVLCGNFFCVVAASMQARKTMLFMGETSFSFDAVRRISTNHAMRCLMYWKHIRVISDRHAVCGQWQTARSLPDTSLHLNAEYIFCDDLQFPEYRCSVSSW